MHVFVSNYITIPIILLLFRLRCKPNRSISSKIIKYTGTKSGTFLANRSILYKELYFSFSYITLSRCLILQVTFIRQLSPERIYLKLIKKRGYSFRCIHVF